MSNRTLRVNELIQRELSEILRKHYQAEATMITIGSVDVTPDLREGRVFVGVIGDAEMAEQKLRWLRKNAQAIRFELCRRIVLKFMPQLTYVLDETTARGNRILHLLDEIETKEPKPAEPAPPTDDKTS